MLKRCADTISERGCDVQKTFRVTTECSDVLFILFAIDNWEQATIKLFHETRLAFFIIIIIGDDTELRN